MSTTVTYGSYPKTTITWSSQTISYIIIQYYGTDVQGNTVTNTISSGQQYGTSYTTVDLSFNLNYNFTMTPYNSINVAGTPKIFTVNTTPAITGLYNSSTTTSTSQLQWYGTYYYVRIYRKIVSPQVTLFSELSANTLFYQPPYNDNDICGNTTYVYYLQPYDANNNPYAPSNTINIYTEPHAARDLSAVFFDASSIKISFTLPRNSYSNSYYYQLNAISGGVTKSVSGQVSPLWVVGLSAGTTYTCYIASYLDGVLRATSNMYSVTTINNLILVSVFYTENNYFTITNVISIYSAYYGYDANPTLLDVTAKVASYVTNGTLTINTPFNDLFTDPAVGIGKKLYIKYYTR